MSEKLRGAQEDRGPVWLMGLITFLRGMVMPRAAALALVACAAPARSPVLQPSATARTSAPADSSGAYATVASVRPIGTFGSSGNSPDAAILPAMGISPAPAPASGALSEIIVRTDGGDTLSVIQPSALALAPGERVMILPVEGGRRLVPVPPSS